MTAVAASWRPTEQLDRRDGHRLAFSVHGAADAPWALMLHGGPGSGCAPHHLDRFDLRLHRVVLLDQRGAGASWPHASEPAFDLTEVTTDHHIADLDALADHLRVDRWLVHGTSWGATLATAYAVARPDRVRAAVLAPVTLTRPSDVQWFTQGVRDRAEPGAWAAFRAVVEPAHEGESLAAAYARRLAGTDPVVAQAAADAWCGWEDALAAAEPGGGPDARFADPAFRLAFARQVTHHFAHAAWRTEDELLEGVRALARVPATLLHGELDVGTPPDVARELHAAWPDSRLKLLAGIGHGGPAMERAIRAATDQVAALLGRSVAPAPPGGLRQE